MGANAAVEASPTLRRVTRRPDLVTYVRQLWRRRHFIRLQASSQALSQHQGTLLGNVWLVLQPLLDGLVYFLIFGLLFSQAKRVDNYTGFLVIGVFLFAFTSRCVGAGTAVLHTNASLIRAFTFPRAALPMALINRELVTLIPTIGTLLVFLLFTGEMPTWRWPLLVCVIALQAVFNLGLALIFARLGHMLADLRTLVSYGLRLWFYGSAVMFPISLLDGRPVLEQIGHANPMFVVLQMARELLVWETVPSVGGWLTLALWAVGTFTVGFVFFWWGEESYGRQHQ